MLNDSSLSDEDYDHVEYLCPQTFDFNTLSGAFFIVIFIFGLIGNVLVLCVLTIYENLKNVQNIFILNLAISDLIFTITLPFWAVYHLHHWIFGDFACKFKIAAYYTGLYSSVILLTAMTVDRFTAVVMHNFHINPATRRICVMVSCAAAWIISIAASMVDAVKVGVSPSWNGDFMCDYQSEDHSEDHSDFDLGYYLQVALLFFLPFAIIVFCYSAILKTVLQASNRKSRRTVVVIFCIVTAFFLCWGPYHILILISSFYIPKGCNAASHLDMAYEICRILAYSHCCMNPFLYLLSQKLRSHFLQLLHCRKYSKKSGERGQSTSGTQHVAFAAQNSTVMLEASFK